MQVKSKHKAQISEQRDSSSLCTRRLFTKYWCHQTQEISCPLMFSIMPNFSECHMHTPTYLDTDLYIEEI